MQYFKPLDNLDQSILDRKPALSYPKVADSVLRGIFEGLIEQGYTEEMATCFITSSILRHELDGNLEDGLADFGRFFAKMVANTYRQDCKKYADKG
jgi:hypothetical protein